MDRPAGLKPVGMGRNAAHGMKADRPATHFFMHLAFPVCPFLFNYNLFFKGGLCQLIGNGFNLAGRNTGSLGNRIRAVFIIQIFIGHQAEYRTGAPAIFQCDACAHLGRDGFLAIATGLASFFIPDKGIALGIAGEQAIICPARIIDHQPGRIGVAAEIINIHLARPHQFMDKSQDK